jgi:hypothetical protein
VKPSHILKGQHQYLFLAGNFTAQLRHRPTGSAGPKAYNRYQNQRPFEAIIACFHWHVGKEVLTAPWKNRLVVIEGPFKEPMHRPRV